jgi:hypothetical protein
MEQLAVVVSKLKKDKSMLTQQAEITVIIHLDMRSPASILSLKR